MSTATARRITVRRIKGGREFFATKLNDSGDVAAWSPDPAAAVQFDADLADSIANQFRKRVESSEHAGRLTILAGDTVVAEVGAEVLPGLELPDDPLAPMPYIPAADLAASLPTDATDGAPAIQLRFVTRPLGSARIAHVDELRSLDAETAASVAKSGAVRFLAVKKQLADHDAESAPRLAALRELIGKLGRERDAAEEDLESPKLASRLRKIAEQVGDAEREIGRIKADRAMLEDLLRRLRPEAEAAVRDSARQAVQSRKESLRLAIAAAAAGVAEKCRAELNEIHNAVMALSSLETSDAGIAVRSAVLRTIGA